ncbi:hypothetical protein ATI61_110225 [Archangium gephyra]|uniref:Lipoprotein n=1 Tax=Archangium gephyra TaxID=48 RepID=A0AAC8THN7_9BACT|nr:hypothetical protein [Archangium gephyra]AKJ06030.1 Hypothetical protein AA314_07656 [Archangium gephyra]REG27218.1 hypothetical protein ATI61_110225 [Archangium gephyra]
MISRDTIRLSLGSVLTGLVLTACGGVSDSGLAPAEESLGTQQSALCTGLAVDGLSIDGISSYNYEVAGSGQFSMSTGANAVRMEYYLDGVLKSATEYSGNSGTWFFSSMLSTCGMHDFEVKAYPMVVDSAGNRTTCFENPSSDTASFEQYCSPTASLDCYRFDEYELVCHASASGGSHSFSQYLWRTDRRMTPTGSHIYSSWTADGSTVYFPCWFPEPRDPYYGTLSIQLKVVDSDGTVTPVVASSAFRCD